MSTPRAIDGSARSTLWTESNQQQDDSPLTARAAQEENAMFWLVLQIITCLLIAAVIGFLIGYALSRWMSGRLGSLLDEENAELRKELQRLRGSSNASARIDGESDVDALRLQLQDQESELLRLRGAETSLGSDINLAADLNECRGELDDARSEIAHLRAQVEAGGTHSLDTDERQRTLELKLSAAEAEVNRLHGDIDRHALAATDVDLEAQLSECRQRLVESHEEIARLNIELSAAASATLGDDSGTSVDAPTPAGTIDGEWRHDTAANFIGEGQQLDLDSAGLGEAEPSRTYSLNDEERPSAIERPLTGADDLRQIRGIGPKIELTLHELGIHTYQQIADWDGDNVAWVNGYLNFPGRIERDQWIAQAHALATGKATEYSERRDRGEVD
ncbi:hypothetical protein OAS86_05430 [Gammaproteobacteria bacterium]|nr:hypothetical protein [Gammaproteobacteria bacterium]